MVVVVLIQISFTLSIPMRAVAVLGLLIAAAVAVSAGTLRTYLPSCILLFVCFHSCSFFVFVVGWFFRCTANSSLPLDSYCGGNCPSGDCVDGCPCGETANPVDIGAICGLYSDWSQECCQCIVNAESSGNANAANENTDGSFDIGVWQVNSQNWASCSNSNPPCDPNAR